MTWLIFALGAVLAVAGAISIASGISYMPVEWGWTEVIAGAVALSGGSITLALGAILFRLGALQKAMHRSADAFSAILGDERSAVAPYVADYSATTEPEQPLALEEQHALPFGSDADAGGMQGTSESADIPARDTGPDIAESLAPSAAQPVAEEVAEPRPDVGPQSETEAASRLPWAKLRARFLKPQGPPAGPTPEPELTPASTPMPESDEATPEPARRPDPEDGAEALSSLSLAAPERRPAETPRRNGSSSRGPSELDPGEPDAGGSFRRVGIADIAAAPTIVGRYEAGGASYVLLSDGSIEVESETGTHRFASMQDLKAFIEAQEPKSAPEDR